MNHHFRVAYLQKLNKQSFTNRLLVGNLNTYNVFHKKIINFMGHFNDMILHIHKKKLI